MKKLIIILLSFLYLPGFGQDITGQWNGTLKIQEGMSLRLIFHISESDSGYTATLDSPDQNAKGIPVTSVSYDSLTLRIAMEPIRASYTGVFRGGIFEGTFSQSGQSFPLRLSRELSEAPVVHRPQEPKEPYPYRALEVRFDGGAEGVHLAGTLTLPDGPGPFPMAILISGSGPQNRDEELMNHKPFLVLADHLTRQGIGVLRYDDRGFAESTGDFSAATSLDFAEDAAAAVRFVRQLPEAGAVGLVGHSEGGLIAPIVASGTEVVDFIVMLAGPGVSGQEILLQQTEAIAAAAGMSRDEIQQELSVSRGVFELMESHADDPTLEQQLRSFLEQAIPGDSVRGMSKKEVIDLQVSQMTRPWFRYFVGHDPADYLKEVTCPVLAINGSKDLQVIPSNLYDIEQSLKAGGNRQVTIREFEGLNHLFQECETGALGEYASISQTFAPVALQVISDWILAQAD